MKRIILIIVLLSVPLFVFFNVWQSFRFNYLSDEVSSLEKQQKDWLEMNKRVISGIAVLSSPARIEKIAKDELGLSIPQPTQVLQIYIRKNGTD